MLFCAYVIQLWSFLIFLWDLILSSKKFEVATNKKQFEQSPYFRRIFRLTTKKCRNCVERCSIWTIIDGNLSTELHLINSPQNGTWTKHKYFVDIIVAQFDSFSEWNNSLWILIASEVQISASENTKHNFDGSEMFNNSRSELITNIDHKSTIIAMSVSIVRLSLIILLTSDA